MMLIPDASGRWEPAPAAPGTQRPTWELIVYRYGADLFYANADRFADQVRELVEKAPQPVQWFVIDVEAIADVDLSAAQTVRTLLKDLSRKGVQVVFGRGNPYLLSDIRRHRIAEVIGEGRIFPTPHEALDAIRPEGAPILIRRGSELLRPARALLIGGHSGGTVDSRRQRRFCALLRRTRLPAEIERAVDQSDVTVGLRKIA